MKHVYTILEGTLEGKVDDKIKKSNLPFAIIFEENGVYFLETFLEKDFYNEDDFSFTFSITGKTEKDYLIEVTGLTYTSYRTLNHKARFICRDSIKLIETKSELGRELTEKDDPLFFIEIEGFNTKFANRTEIKKIRKYGEIDNFDVNFDHTSTAMYIQLEGFTENYFHLVFYKSKINDNIIIDFTQNGGYGMLTYNHYKLFKDQFVGFLSLLNGGNVLVRRELTGKFYNTDGSNSHVTYIYSFNKKSNFISSEYVPIDYHHSYSSDIFFKAFLNCFNNYYHNDLKLELSSIVSALNQSFETPRIEESYAILINALEKLSTKYQEKNGQNQEIFVDDNYWDNIIKPQLLDVLNKNKSQILKSNKTAFNNFKAKIGDMNRKKNSTVEKMYELFSFACIPINKNVESLVIEERHTAVHNGTFGETFEEMFNNYYKLDHILRDIILNIINYRSYRKHVRQYATEEERKSAYPERIDKTEPYFCSQPYRK